MKINKNLMHEIEKYKNSIYDDIKIEFLYNSNKLEGSSFSKDEFIYMVDKNIVEGKHTLDDVHETYNSIVLYEFIIDSLGEPLNKDMLCEWHKILKKNTTDEKLGLSGHYKTMMNRIHNSSIQLAFPNEVHDAIEELIQDWYTKENITIKDIAEFHRRFEHIHPFQDGNGRIGRFIMLKQCIENEIDLIAIDEVYDNAYKTALEFAQFNYDNIEPLITIFKDCQMRLDTKLEIYNSSLEHLKNG